MEKSLQLINLFEKKNNISVTIILCSDGSGTVNEFWNDEELKEFRNIDALHEFLNNTQYKLDSDGICLSPVQEAEQQPATSN